MLPMRLVLSYVLFVAGCSSCESASVTEPPPLLDGVGFERSFGGVAFERPLFLTAPAGGTDRGFVVDQGGRIFSIDTTSPEPVAKVFLDLSSKVSRVGNEEGLLGMAFHPSYTENGRFFVYYSAPGPISVLS